MHFFSNLFDKVLLMFRTGSSSGVSQPCNNSYLSCYFCWHLLAWSGWNSAYFVIPYCRVGFIQFLFGVPILIYFLCLFGIGHASRRQQNQHDKYLLHIYSVEIFLMMDSGPVQNMQSTISNRCEKQCVSLAFIIRICTVL